MKRTNILSCLLVMLFMISCMCFFSVSAEPDSDDTTAKPTETVATKATTTHHTTTKATTTTEATTNATKAPAKKTKKATSADPTYAKKTTTTKAKSSPAGIVTSGYTTEATAETKETKEIQTTETTTEATTAAKNIINYGSKYRPIKWLSLVVMIGCVIALVVINVRYKKKYGKYSGKGNGKGNKKVAKKNDAPKLDTAARFDEPKTQQRQQYQRPTMSADENLDKTTVVDISSFSNKNHNNDFKPKASNSRNIDNDIFNDKNEKNDDDDLYI